MGRAEIAWNRITGDGGHISQELLREELKEDERPPEVEILMDVIEHAYVPNPVEAEFYLQAKYETMFGIQDHYAPDDPEVPWPHMAKSPKEDLSRLNLEGFRMDQFVNYQVQRIFGIDFDQFMDRPRRNLLEMLESAAKHSKAINSSTDADIGKLEEGIKDIKNRTANQQKK